jgi:hypothetical protein
MSGITRLLVNLIYLSNALFFVELSAMRYTVHKIMHQEDFNQNPENGKVTCAPAFYSTLMPIISLIATTLAIFFFSLFLFPQNVSAWGPYYNPAVVDLESAETFLLFSKAGITDDLMSSITGNVGVSPAAAATMVGIPCANISGGRMYTITAPLTPVGCITTAETLAGDNAKLSTAATDFDLAYVDARSLVTHPADVTIGAATGLTGTYGRGVYAFGGAVSTGEVITIRGSSTDIFVFQITGAYTQPVAGQMQLMNDVGVVDGSNGPKATNIFWAIDGAVSTAANTSFVGTVLTTGAFSLGDGASFNGRAFANGLMTSASSTIFVTPVQGPPPHRSSSYTIEESAFSTGSGFGASNSYDTQYSVGDIGIGPSFSTTYGAYAGPIAPNEEYLELVVSTSLVDLGNLQTDETAAGVASFHVRAYINGDYVVYSRSTSPVNENGTDLDPMTVAATSTIGTEQFGFNLVDNTTPNVGTDPAPYPGVTFANGEAATGYDTADNYKSVADEVIARSGVTGRAWGRTDFTISYIANIKSTTEPGTYTMAHDLVVTATF